MQSYELKWKYERQLLLFLFIFQRALEPLPNNSVGRNKALYSMRVYQNERHYMLQLRWHTWLPGQHENTTVNVRRWLITSHS